MSLKIEESFRYICYENQNFHNRVADESPRLDVTHGTHLILIVKKNNRHTRKVPWHLSQRWSRFYT